LAKAGYPNGFETSITYAVGRYLLQQEIVTAIQAQLAQVGIKARLNPLEDGVYRVTTRKPLQDNPLEMNITAWSSVVGDVSFLIGAVFVPSAIPPSCCNTMFWENRGVVDLYRASLEQTDIDKRLGQLRAIQQIVNQEVPQVHLFVYRQITAQTARLAGMRVPPNQHWYVGRARFTR
jgi:peptide/nickel transport system substrate-binding protein